MPGAAADASGEPPSTAAGSGESSVGWWDGSGVLAEVAPVVAAQGACAGLGGMSLALLGSGSLSLVCEGSPGSLSGSPRGVAWRDGIDSQGPFVEVRLVGAAGLAAEAYGALGDLDVVFEGGAFAVDFTGCAHKAAPGWSSCAVTARDVSLPPGRFVGVGTVGIERPRRSVVGAGSTAATPASQRAALVALYDATDGPNWTRNTGWDTALPVSQWYGVTSDTDGNVTYLYLPHNGLSGSIPGGIGGLSHLRWLSLASNRLPGPIPVEIGDLTRLTYLDLGGASGLSSSIPAEIGSLAQLTHLDLGPNRLSGPVPARVWGLTKLTHLDLGGGNSLTGSIPAEIGNLTQLSYLRLEGNRFTGAVPARVWGLTKLTHLDLGANEFTGSIPVEVGNLTALGYLALGFNRFSGSIPAQIWGLTGLSHLDLASNRLSGSIPTEVGNLTGLRRLRLSWNYLTGPIPSQIGNLTQLTWLDLGGNYLTGPIPSQIGNLTRLTRLDLGSRNRFTGSIPAEIWEMTSLRHLDLSGGRLSGSISAKIGNLTKLESVDLHSNRLSGAIPTQIGRLTNLRSLWLNDNRLTGSVPTELANLDRLESLRLVRNDLSGCVPGALARIRRIDFDADLSFCALASLRITRARAVESDGEAVFTITVEPPASGAAATPVRVDYATSAASALPGADFAHVSGTLRIPAGARHASVSVPLVDDTVAEGLEGFSLRLTNPAGAALVGDTTALATITDDDHGPATTPPPITPCEGVVLRGSVAGVFDIAQSGYSQWSDAFVDVDVACGDGGSPVGMPVGVEVVSGPAASLGRSGHCIARSGTLELTRSVGEGHGCVTFAVTRPVAGGTDGRSTHLVRVPDASVGRVHQLLVWVDADRDGTHDFGERYQYVESDFVGRSVGGATQAGFGLPERFEVSLVTPFSDRVSRAGRYTSLRLSVKTRTSEVIGHTFGGPVYRTVPVAHVPVGVSMLAGPSRAAGVMCSVPPTDAVPSPGYSEVCATDARGHLDVRFLVPPGAVSVLRAQTDVLRVWLDADRDGSYDFETVDEQNRIVTPEPSSAIRIPVAKAVNYVALGDSYSSGEQGTLATDGSKGTYQSGISPADRHCRRWSLAYPNVFVDDILRGADPGIDIEFHTFACTGAKTVNVHDPRDPTGDSDDLEHHQSNRPSSKADADEYIIPPPMDQHGNPIDTPTVVYPPTDYWEPRQAASLAGVQVMGDVDMVTVTIGGNDTDFASVLRKCVLGGRDCGRRHLPSDFDEIPGRLAALLAELKRVAPNASIFVLGYPNLTPLPVESNRALIESCGLFGRPLHASGITTNPITASAHLLLGGNVADAAISYTEAQFLHSMAVELNGILSLAARAAGVYFVDVIGTTVSPSSGTGFADHSPCSTTPWLNGFVRKSGVPPVSDRSFHPNRDGHEAYAEVLEAYIEYLIESGVALNESGLPINPSPADQ